MLKVLSARLHGVLDYVIALAFIVAPAALELAYPAEALAYITGASISGWCSSPAIRSACLSSFRIRSMA